LSIKRKRTWPRSPGVESGEAVELHVRDASDEQINRDSGAEDVARLDLTHVNPVSGPVFVKGAQARDVLAVELLEFTPPEWGWTAIIPGFGLLADEFPDPWLRISEVDGERVRFSESISLPCRPFPGTIGVAPSEPGYIVGGWLLLGIAITLAFPGLARRIGRNLSRAEGIAMPEE
jgi:acetamidase/formamidase